MQTQRWINQTQPQTLVIAVMLMYFDAAFALFYAVLGAFGLVTLIELAGVAAGWGIANERKWGYWLGVVIATFGLVIALSFGQLLSIPMLIAVAKFALLVHPQSREYQKIWFK